MNNSAAVATAYSSDSGGMVAQIARGDPAAMQRLYDNFGGIRRYLQRKSGSGPGDLEDLVHDAFIATVEAIRKGGLRNPDCVWGLALTVARRSVTRRWKRTAAEDLIRRTHDHRDRRPNPEQLAMAAEPVRQAFSQVSQEDREILTRFYLYGESEKEICRVMRLSETQFRNLKSRAKKRFGEAGRRPFLDREFLLKCHPNS